MKRQSQMLGIIALSGILRFGAVEGLVPVKGADRSFQKPSLNATSSSLPVPYQPFLFISLDGSGSHVKRASETGIKGYNKQKASSGKTVLYSEGKMWDFGLPGFNDKSNTKPPKYTYQPRADDLPKVLTKVTQVYLQKIVNLRNDLTKQELFEEIPSLFPNAIFFSEMPIQFKYDGETNGKTWETLAPSFTVKVKLDQYDIGQKPTAYSMTYNYAADQNNKDNHAAESAATRNDQTIAVYKLVLIEQSGSKSQKITYTANVKAVQYSVDFKMTPLSYSDTTLGIRRINGMYIKTSTTDPKTQKTITRNVVGIHIPNSLIWLDSQSLLDGFIRQFTETMGQFPDVIVGDFNLDVSQIGDPGKQGFLGQTIRQYTVNAAGQASFGNKQDSSPAGLKQVGKDWPTKTINKNNNPTPDTNAQVMVQNTNGKGTAKLLGLYKSCGTLFSTGKDDKGNKILDPICSDDNKKIVLGPLTNPGFPYAYDNKNNLISADQSNWSITQATILQISAICQIRSDCLPVVVKEDGSQDTTSDNNYFSDHAGLYGQIYQGGNW